MMKFCKCEMTSDLYHLYFLQFASYQLRMSGTVNAKVHSGYFGQNKLMLIQQRSVNVYKFLVNHTVILFHVSFISGPLPFTIPFARLFHYKSGCGPVAGVVERMGQFEGYIVSVKMQ